MFEIFEIDGPLKKPYLGEPLVVALGNFDGVHLGHAKIIDATCKLSKKLSAESAALAFDVHPQIRLEKTPFKLITSEEDRFLLLRRAGIKYVIRANFDSFKDMPYEEFLSVLSEKMNCCGAVCGYNFRFGKNGEGSACNIKDFFGENSVVVERFSLNGTSVSSSEVRSMVECGNVKSAALLLGRFFSVSGVVDEGRHIGRKINFPTANITIDKFYLAPAEGIYATFTEVDRKIYSSVTNYGTNPTVSDNGKFVLETNIMDFDSDIYGKRINVYFAEKIRVPQKFDSLESLQKAISEDKLAAEKICASIRKESKFSTMFINPLCKYEK